MMLHFVRWFSLLLVVGLWVGCSDKSNSNDKGDSNEVPPDELVDEKLETLSGRCNERSESLWTEVCPGDGEQCVGACTLFVAADGDDTHPGTQAAPLKSVGTAVAKVENGGVICLRRGDIFREEVEVPNQWYYTEEGPLVIQSYGAKADPQPILSGATQIPATFTASDVGTGVMEVDLSNVFWTGESHSSGGTAVTPHDKIYQLFVNGAPMVLARFPNIGEGDSTTDEIPIPDGNYSIIDSIDGASFTDTALPNLDFTGAMIHHRSNRWVIRREEVASHDVAAQTLTATAPIECASDDGCLGYGYFIHDHLNALDAPGEWFYDDVSKTLYVIPLDGMDLNDATVEATTYRVDVMPYEWENPAPKEVYTEGIHLGSSNHIRILDVGFEYYSLAGISGASTISDGSVDHADATTDIEIIGCNFAYTGPSGVNIARWEDTVTVDGNNVVSAGTFVGQMSQAVLMQTSHSEISCNDVSDIGLLQNYPRLGMYGNGLTVNDQGMALMSNVNDVEIAFNRISKTASAGITFRGRDAVIANNVVREACYTKGDCGGIHTYDWGDAQFDSPSIQGSVVSHNLVFDTYGASEGAGEHHRDPLGQGFFLDFGAQDYVVQNNVIAGSTTSGILISLNRNVTIRNNLLYRNAWVNSWNYPSSQLHIATSMPPTNATVTDNVIVATTPVEIPLGIRGDTVAQAGTFENNAYIDPFAFDCTSAEDRWHGYLMFADNETDGRTGYHVRKWQQVSGETPRTVPFYWHAYETTAVGSNLITNSTFDANIDGWTIPEYSTVGVSADSHDVLGPSLHYLRNDGEGGGIEVISNPFSLEAGKTYALKYWIAPDENETAPHPPIVLVNGEQWNFLPADRIREVQYVFTAGSDQPNATLGFSAYPLYTDEFFVDDVTLMEVEATPAATHAVIRFSEEIPDTRSVLIYNDSDKVKQVSLNDAYVDIDGVNLTSPIEVSPFDAVVIFKKSATQPQPK